MAKNKYVDFISDEHLLKCVENLYKSYRKAKNKISKKNFYSNKVDVFKITFDSKFNDISEEDLINAEILRQIDKSINNSIGTFHEQILGGVEGFEVGNLSGFDIKATDNSLFAIFLRNPVSRLIEYSIFEQLSTQANVFRNSTCYLVDFEIEDYYLEIFNITKGELSTSHKNVFRISLKKFYQLLTKDQNAFSDLQRRLPNIIDDCLQRSK